MASGVLIVDDDAPFRVLARTLLQSEGFDVVGEASNAASALACCRRLRPRLVLLDVQLPGPDGFEVARLLAAQPDPPIVVLISSRGASSYRQRLVTTTARGFLAKEDLSGASLTALLG